MTADQRKSATPAVVLGASGSVGNALIAELLRNGSFKPIVTFVRRLQPEQITTARAAGIELREILVASMEPASLELATTEAIRSLRGEVVGLSALGVGAGTGKLTRDEHRAVDVHLNAAFVGYRISRRYQIPARQRVSDTRGTGYRIPPCRVSCAAVQPARCRAGRQRAQMHA